MKKIIFLCSFFVVSTVFAAVEYVDVAACKQWRGGVVGWSCSQIYTQMIGFPTADSVQYEINELNQRIYNQDLEIERLSNRLAILEKKLEEKNR